MDNPLPNNTQIPPLPEISKQDIIEKKKKHFFALFKAAKFSIIILMILAFSFYLVRLLHVNTKDTYVSIPKETNQTTETEKQNPDGSSEAALFWERYENEQYKFSVEYPAKDNFLISSDKDAATLITIIAEEALPKENPTGMKMLKGYIVTINPLSIAKKSLDDVINIKREWYVLNCPSTANISQVYGSEIDKLDARYFTASACNSDFVVYYTRTDEIFYEITQIYKGDLGYKQIFKNTSGEIVQRISIFRSGPPEPDPYIYYDNKVAGIGFSYPRVLNTTCCRVVDPPVQKIQILLTLSEGSNESAAGLYIAHIGDMLFDDFLTDQKNILIEEYKIAKGYIPQGRENYFAVGNLQAVRLSNYSWKENDLIYIKNPNNDKVLIVSKTGFSEETLAQILKSLTFY